MHILARTTLVAGAAFLLAAQTPPPAPEFDAVFLQPSPTPLSFPGMPAMALQRMLLRQRLEFSTGKVSGRNVSVRRMILQAYRLPESQLDGGPDWLDNEQFDLEAKADVPADDLQLSQMLQTMLAQRFKLTIRHETRQLTVDALTVRKSGPKLPAWKEGDPKPELFRKKGITGVYLSHGTMQAFADELSHEQFYRPVIDRTGLSGTYLIHMEWGEGGNKINSLGQLGLQLRAQKAPVDVLLVDHIDRPEEE
jgi:uncharacterized protein (TIGR03435 family)